MDIEKILEKTNLTFQIAAPQGDYCNEKWRATVSKKWWNDNISCYEYELEADSFNEIQKKIWDEAVKLRPELIENNEN